MRPAVVVDVGNTRVKWGRCEPNGVVAVASLPPDDPSAWARQVADWGLVGRLAWVVSGVHPRRRDALAEWLRQQGYHVSVVDSPRQLPLRVLLERPDHVGIDRLLNAVAANSRRPAGVPAILIDAGSAVTVDWLDEQGAFGGGAILPGLRLMAQALHDYTALLPLIEVRQPRPPLPGTSTPAAMQAGLYWAAAGGVRSLVAELTARSARRPQVWLAGGDGPLLAPALEGDLLAWPDMTLEGLRLAAERLP